MSGRKNNLRKYPIISAASMATSLTSAVTNIQHMDNIGIQVNMVSVNAAGTLQVQVSADYEQDFLGNVLNAGNWIDLSPASQVIAAGAPDQVYFDLMELSAPWIRLVYTRTGGVGTMNAFITGKML